MRDFLPLYILNALPLPNVEAFFRHIYSIGSKFQKGGYKIQNLSMVDDGG